MKVIIDGELEDVSSVFIHGYLPMVSIGNRDYYLAEDEESAGKAARKYWEDMANDDKKEFVAIIGEERLLQWAMNEGDAYGCSSLNDFLDLVETVPEEEFAGYDGNPLEASTTLGDAKNVDDFINEVTDPGDSPVEDQMVELENELEELAEELGFEPTVAYRHN